MNYNHNISLNFTKCFSCLFLTTPYLLFAVTTVPFPKLNQTMCRYCRKSQKVNLQNRRVLMFLTGNWVDN